MLYQRDSSEDELFFGTKVKDEPFIASPHKAFWISKGQKHLKCIQYSFGPNGTMQDYLIKSGKLSLPIVKLYTKQLITAILATHAAGVSHRDLKLDNIVLDANFNLKVIDFGAACSINGSDGSGWFMNGEVAGTESYMSPEMLLNMPY